MSEDRFQEPRRGFVVLARHLGAGAGNEPVTEEFQRTCESLRQAGADIAILASVANVTYATGVEAPIPFGALPELTYAPWMAIIDARSEQGNVVVPGFAVAHFGTGTGFTGFGYEGMDSFQPTDPRGTCLDAVAEALNAAGMSDSATVAIESRAVPAMVIDLVQSRWPQAKCIEAETAMATARQIKTDWEIEKLRFASRLSDTGQTTLAQLIQTGNRTEIDCWTALSAAIFQTAGREIVLSGELISGPRTATVRYPNGPWDRAIEPGDGVLMDLSGRFDGYWFDCTNTHIAGGETPTAEQRRFANASRDACEAAMAALRPGAKASDAFAASERAFAAHGLPAAHYAGHQIGVTVNELPRLVPYDHTTIEAGMVFCVEPGAYQGEGGTFGARSEKMVLVTPSGPEILSTFAWGIA